MSNLAYVGSVTVPVFVPDNLSIEQQDAILDKVSALLEQWITTEDGNDIDAGIGELGRVLEAG